MILTKNEIEEVLTSLEKPNGLFEKNYPGSPIGRKAVHTVYGGAQLFVSDRTERIGKAAMRSFEHYVNNFVEFAQILQLQGFKNLPSGTEEIDTLENEIRENTDRSHPAWLAYTVYERVKQKLKEEAVEDFRIDFEDGFGKRTDEEEDHYAEFTAKELAKGMEEGTISPFIGIRIKPLSEDLKHRSITTLNIFISTLLSETGGKLPDNFVITLPKVSLAEEVKTLDSILQIIEKKKGLEPNSLKVEIMVETPQSLINSDGSMNLPKMIQPARERIVGAHFGVYDYTASVNIIAKYQEMDHMACDFARHIMKVSLSGTGIRLSDGATNILPVGPHRAGEGETLNDEQEQKNREVVHRAWKLGFDHINHSLQNAYYQGWDLHPAQLPIRYAAVYSFFLQNLQNSIDRVQSFVSRAAQATLTGDVFDDAATALALLNYFNLGLESGAIREEEAQETGLTLDEIHSHSFDLIVENRK